MVYTVHEGKKLHFRLPWERRKDRVKDLLFTGEDKVDTGSIYKTEVLEKHRRHQSLTNSSQKIRTNLSLIIGVELT